MRRKTNYIDNLIAKRHYVAPEVLVERIEESDMVAQSPNSGTGGDANGNGGEGSDNDQNNALGAKSNNIFFGGGWSEDEE